MNESKVERIASTILAFEHRDEGELRRYLQRHPDADKSKHWVKPVVEHDKEVKDKAKKSDPLSANTKKELEKRINELREKIETYETKAKKAKKDGNVQEAEKSEDLVRNYFEKLKTLEGKMEPYKDWLAKDK